MDENQMGGVQVDTAEYAADLKAAEVPQLVFGAEPEFAPAEEVKPVEAKPVQSAAQAIVNNDILTEAEKKAVQQLQKQINISDTNAILQYGVGTQKKMSEFSDAALQTVRTRDLGEVGDMLTGVISNLESFNTEDKNEGGFFGLFKKPKKKVKPISRWQMFPKRTIETEAEIDEYVENIRKRMKTMLKDCDGIQLD